MTQPRSLDLSRRHALETLARLAGGVVLVPFVSACEPAAKKPAAEPAAKAAETPAPGVQAGAASAIPLAQPEAWDAITYNKVRGNAGAIPESYRASINGPDGDVAHLGKHLPYQPKVEATLVPAGFVAIMWGDPAKGHARHPNAAKTADNPEGHWYNSIKIRKAVEGPAEELESSYLDWPGQEPASTGSYAVFGGGKMDDDGGKNAIYLAKLPAGLQSGDTVRIHAHCLTHGEYVDFLTLA